MSLPHSLVITVFECELATEGRHFSRAPSAGVMEPCANDPTYRTSCQGHSPLREDSHHPISQMRKLRLREMPGLAKVAPAVSGGGWLGSKQLMAPASSPESKPMKRGAKPYSKRKKDALAQTKFWGKCHLKKSLQCIIKFKQ